MTTEAGCEIAKLANWAVLELSDGELGAPEVDPRPGAGETMLLIFFLRFFIVSVAMSISCSQDRRGVVVVGEREEAGASRRRAPHWPAAAGPNDTVRPSPPPRPLQAVLSASTLGHRLSSELHHACPTSPLVVIRLATRSAPSHARRLKC
jgi:hypothetical protein